MKAMQRKVLFLVSCICLCLGFCLYAGAEDGAAKQGLSTYALVSLIVGGVVVVALIVLAIVKRQKLAESLRAYRSEMKKITWYPWKAVWRNTVLVIVIVLATALVVGLLDIAFFEVQYMLTGQGFSFFGR